MSVSIKVKMWHSHSLLDRGSEMDGRKVGPDTGAP